jgi:hypothetical protein
MKSKAKKVKNKEWVATRTEVRDLLGLRDKNLSHLEKWAGINTASRKAGYSFKEFQRLKRRVSALRRKVTLLRASYED